MHAGTKVYFYLLFSSLFYGLGAVTEFIVIRHAPFGASLFLFAIGGFLFLPLFLKLSNAKVKPPKPIYWIFSGIASLVVSVFLVILYLGYARFTLASMYPLIGVAGLVFLLIDTVIYHKRIRSEKLLLLSFGVFLVTIGVYFAEIKDAKFQIQTLPFVLGIAALSGVGYYLQYYKIHKYTAGSKVLLEPVFLLLFALLFSIPVANVGLFYAFLGVFSGAMTLGGSAFELAAVNTEKAKTTEQYVIKKNFIINFENSDILIVLAGSILVGSYYPIEIFGGMLIVVGLVLIDALK
ncbi:MAG: hypothetical protein ACP5MC_03150 [Candidatus Micrarchaeia archaeon]